MSYRIRVPSKTTPLDETQLMSGIERFLLGMQENRRTVLVGAGVLLLAVTVVGGIVWFDQQTNQKALTLLREATLHYQTRPADKPELADKNLRSAIAMYQQVVDQYPRTLSAPIALYHLGNALGQTNELDASIEAHKRFLLMYSGQSNLVGLVQQRVGYSYLMKGNRDEAAKAFSAVLQLPGALNKDHVLFELGKLEEAQARPEGALAHYQDLIKTYPNSPFASEAAVRTKVLEVKKSPDAPPGGIPPVPSAPSPGKDNKRDLSSQGGSGSNKP